MGRLAERINQLSFALNQVPGIAERGKRCTISEDSPDFDELRDFVWRSAGHIEKLPEQIIKRKKSSSGKFSRVRFAFFVFQDEGYRVNDADCQQHITGFGNTIADNRKIKFDSTQAQRFV